MNEEAEANLLSLCEIYQRELKNGSITDPDREMYQHCIAALQRIHQRQRSDHEMQDVIGGWWEKS